MFLATSLPKVVLSHLQSTLRPFRMGASACRPHETFTLERRSMSGMLLATFSGTASIQKRVLQVCTVSAFACTWLCCLFHYSHCCCTGDPYDLTHCVQCAQCYRGIHTACLGACASDSPLTCKVCISLVKRNLDMDAPPSPSIRFAMLCSLALW